MKTTSAHPFMEKAKDLILNIHQVHSLIPSLALLFALLVESRKRTYDEFVEPSAKLTKVW